MVWRVEVLQGEEEEEEKEGGFKRKVMRWLEQSGRWGSWVHPLKNACRPAPEIILCSEVGGRAGVGGGANSFGALLLALEPSQ